MPDMRPGLEGAVQGPVCLAELVRAKNYCFVTAGRHLDIVPDVPKPSPTAPRRKRKPQKLFLVSHIPPVQHPSGAAHDGHLKIDCGSMWGSQWTAMGAGQRLATCPRTKGDVPRE
jgi:hypothetical protein